MIALAMGGFLAGVAGADNFPVDDAFPRHQEKPKPVLNKAPRQDVPIGTYRELNPNLTDAINEPHPIPEYLKKFVDGQGIPRYYHELLEIEPVDQVQSKIFNPELFAKVRRIGVVGFENKIPDRFRDEKAGEMLAEEFARELGTIKKYFVTPPYQMREDVRLRIVKTPKTGSTKGGKEDKSMAFEPGKGYDLPYSSENLDAVLIGAVTRYTNEYKDRRGNIQKSSTAGVEFAAYLVSTNTGEVIWGARFVGSQLPTVANLFTGKTKWMDKKELSRYAIQKSMDDFRKTGNLPKPIVTP